MFLKAALFAVALVMLSQQDRILSPSFKPPPARFSVLVTGAGAGIGESFCRRLISTFGARVRVYGTVRRLGSLNVTDAIELVVADVADYASVEQAVKQIDNEAYPLFAVVNNAGVAARGPFEYMEPALMKRLIDTNVLGAMYVARATLSLLKTNHGRLINVGSLSGERAFSMQSLYSASKFALRGWSEGLRRQLHGRVAVSLVQPGVTFTKMITGLKNSQLPEEQIQEYSHQFDEAYQARMGRLAARIGLPTEAVDDVLLHALSDARPHARYLTTALKYQVYLYQLLPDWAADRIQIWLEG
jgi:NAD(P)-dependent dehydrogenase (short-subunit alcohol dehydrogenase family)